MTTQRKTYEYSSFSTGNGGASFKIVRDSESDGDEYPQYKMVSEVSHYGLTQSSEAVIHDIGVMDEMIAMMQRARAAIAVENESFAGYPGKARISQMVVDSTVVQGS